MTHRIRINLTYNGADFYGWQRQTKHGPTVQGVLEEKLSQIFNSPIRVVGSGRTDRGAHALSQWAHADVPQDPAGMNLQYRLNRLTPDSLRVNSVELAPREFHAQRSALKKKYIYQVYQAPLPHPLSLDQSYYVRTALDVNLLNKLASYLTGEQDFKSFQSVGTDVESTVRHIYKAYWRAEGPHLRFHIIGNGFLKQMVRNIVGTMLWCAQQKDPTHEFQAILAAKDRRKAKDPAPAHALFLKWVKYPSLLDNKCRKL